MVIDNRQKNKNGHCEWPFLFDLERALDRRWLRQRSAGLPLLMLVPLPPGESGDRCAPD